jgi:hypothetical protein
MFIISWSEPRSPLCRCNVATPAPASVSSHLSIHYHTHTHIHNIRVIGLCNIPLQVINSLFLFNFNIVLYVHMFVVQLLDIHSFYRAIRIFHPRSQGSEVFI